MDRLFRSDGGGLELIGLSDDGVVTVRFTGFCTGCMARPVTTAAAILPALRRLDGVRDVKVAGSRISEEAEERMAYYFQIAAPSGSPDRIPLRQMDDDHR